MEKFKHEQYRSQLAKDLKNIEDHGERKEVLESEQESSRYKTAKEKHLVDVAAHPEKVRTARLEELEKEGEMIEFLKGVLENEEQKRDKEKPFSEYESYYANSSHSQWNEDFAGLRWLPREKADLLANLARRDEKWAKVVAELDKYTLTGYVTSATKDEIDYEKNPDKWFHTPFSGVMVTFNEILENDGRAFQGFGIKDGKEVASDPRISAIIPDFEKASKLLNEAVIRGERGGFSGRYEPQKRAEAIALLKEIHAKLVGINGGILMGVDEFVNTIEESVKEEKNELQK